MLENSVRGWVHILFTAIFGLVLPFICWGAEATPGHPHSRAHIVFLPPALSDDARAVVHAAAAALAEGAHDLCGAPKPAATPAPVAKSTPSVLAVTLLLGVLAVQVLLLRRDKAGFAQRTAGLFVISPPLAIATPPPR